MSDLDLLVTRAQTVGGISRVYKIGEVPKRPDGAYVVLSLDTGTPETYTLDGSSNTRHRISAQAFGTSHTAVADMAARLDNAFRDMTLTELDDDPKCQRELATAVVRDPDGEVLLYVLHTYRY